MSKRAMLIGTLVLCLVSMVETRVVMAQTIGGIRIIGINSIEVESILKQLKNTAITEPAYEVVMFLQEVSVMCKNPAGKPELANNGRPFNIDHAAISQTQTSEDLAITKNGRALSVIFFSDPELLRAVSAVLGNVCNENWTGRTIVVNAMQVFGTLFSCQAGGNPTNPRATGCAIADALGMQCFAPDGVDLFSAEFEYECVTICAGGTCPQPPVELPFP